MTFERLHEVFALQAQNPAMNFPCLITHDDIGVDKPVVTPQAVIYLSVMVP